MHQETLLGNWPRTSISSRELKGKTIGLLGFGLIAKKVSLLANVFNAQIIAHDPFIGQNIGDEFNAKLLRMSYLSLLILLLYIYLLQTLLKIYSIIMLLRRC